MFSPMSTETEPSSIEVLAFKSGLCLAQAQERILDRSLLDNRKPGNIANENKFINSRKFLAWTACRASMVLVW